MYDLDILSSINILINRVEVLIYLMLFGLMLMLYKLFRGMKK